jgi:hypothetical protein
VADRGDRPAAGRERLDEADRVRVDPQPVGVDGAAGQQQGVVFIRPRLADQAVNRQGACRYQIELAGLDLAAVHRQQVTRGARAVQRAARLL